MMTEYKNGLERRKTPRKEIYLPIKLSARGDIIATGHALDISCYGVKLGLKLEIVFKTKEDEQVMDQVLAAPELRLEIGSPGAQLHISAPARVKWSDSSYGEGEKIYEAGLDLNLTETQKKEWEAFYRRL